MRKLQLLLIAFLFSNAIYSQISSIGSYGSTAAGKQIHDTAAYLRTEFDTVPFAYDLIRESEISNRTIYVSTYIGNDTIGDGSIGSQYRTIGRALEDIKYYIIGVTITIQCDSGSYSIDENDSKLLWDHYVIGTAYPISIDGFYIEIENGLTITAQSPNDFLYRASGVSWTTNQYKYDFVRRQDNAAMYPIYSNTSDSLVIGYPGYSSMKEICELKTNIAIDGLGVNSNPMCGTWDGKSGRKARLQWRYIKFIHAARISLDGDEQQFISCYIENTSTTSPGVVSNSNGSTLFYCYLVSNYTGSNIFTSALAFPDRDSHMSRCVIENVQGQYGSGIYAIYDCEVYNGGIISGFKNGITMLSTKPQLLQSSFYFIDCENMIGDYLGSFVSYTLSPGYSTFIDSVTYLFNFSGNPFVSVHSMNLIDEYGITSIFNPSSTINELINIKKGIFIEADSNVTNITSNSFTLNDSTITTIMQGVIPDTTWVRNKILELLP